MNRKKYAILFLSALFLVGAVFSFFETKSDDK